MKRTDQDGRAITSTGRNLLFTAIAVIGMTLVPLAPSLANGGAWRVSDIQGDARVRTGQLAWQALQRGQEIPPESQVETGKAARVLLVRPGDSIAVSPNSLFTVPKGALRRSTPANPTTHIDQKRGTLLFKITTRPDKPFSVKTPYLAAVIKGTTFTVTVNPQTAALHVSKGAVQVDSILTGERILVRPGQTAAVGPADGGRLRMIGRAYTPRGRAAQKNAAAAKKRRAIANGGIKAGLRIRETVGAGQVDIAKVSNGLLVETPPAIALRPADAGKASDAEAKASGKKEPGSSASSGRAAGRIPDAGVAARGATEPPAAPVGNGDVAPATLSLPTPSSAPAAPSNGHAAATVTPRAPTMVLVPASPKAVAAAPRLSGPPALGAPSAGNSGANVSVPAVAGNSGKTPPGRPPSLGASNAGNGGGGGESSAFASVLGTAGNSGRTPPGRNKGKKR